MSSKAARLGCRWGREVRGNREQRIVFYARVIGQCPDDGTPKISADVTFGPASVLRVFSLDGSVSCEATLPANLICFASIGTFWNVILSQAHAKAGVYR